MILMICAVFREISRNYHEQDGSSNEAHGVSRETDGNCNFTLLRWTKVQLAAFKLNDRELHQVIFDSISSGLPSLAPGGEAADNHERVEAFLGEGQ